MAFPVRASQRLEEVDAAGHRLTELSDMLIKGELSDIADIKENRKRIVGHFFSTSGYIWFSSASAQSTLKKVVSQMDVLKVNLA